MTHSPIAFEWDGIAMIPKRGFAKKADSIYVIGQSYILEEIHSRSSKTHRHYFACVKAAWESLPEDLLEKYPNEDILRKEMLVKSGFCTMEYKSFATSNAAVQAASLIHSVDKFAIVNVTDTTVRIFKPESQNMRAMSKEKFQASKVAVLNSIAELLEIDRESLENIVD